MSTSFSGTGTPTSNPNSSGAVSLSIPGQSNVSGSISHNVTASPAGNSGVFSVRGSANGVQSGNPTTANVPPQVLVQMMYGEANGAGSTAQLAVGIVARNRIDDSTYFPTNTNYQNTIVSSQFNGINTSITTGVTPELDNAVNVWLRITSDFTTPLGKNANLCFWTPSSTDSTAINNALQSGTTNEAGIPNATGCFPTGNGQQIRVVTSVGTNSSGVPWFVFQGARSSTSDPVVVRVN